MSAELLPYYDKELTFIRRMAAQFAADHPKIAQRLRLGPDSSEDPHVERLIQAFAYLCARIRFKLDDDFPEITESLLGVLYPHYQAPIPSLAIVQFDLGPQENELATGHAIARHAPLETEPVQGEPCRFRTCYETKIWPIEVESATLARLPMAVPPLPGGASQMSQVASVLRLVLRCRSQKLRFRDLGLSSLRFFLKGQPQHVSRLYELIFNNTLEVAMTVSSRDPGAKFLSAESLQPGGFGRDEGLFPYPARSFVGYRLLTEYFAFPEKYLFVDLVGLAGRLPDSGRLEVYLYFNRAFADLEQNISADTFRLGCTPIVNLYSQRAEPIELTHTQHEYRVVPDARRPLAHEVYTIDRVMASAEGAKPVEYLPFFSIKHAAERPNAFWHASRRPATEHAGRESPRNDRGTEVYLALVDLQRESALAPGWTLDLETTCFNRDLPQRLPFGGGQPVLHLSEGAGLVAKITCLTPPTPTLRPAAKQGTLWRLISHLSLNHLSLVDESDDGEALREILKLYDFADSTETRAMIDGVLQVRGQRVVGRAQGGRAFCRGVEVEVRFDAERFTGSGLFLFASVLERFLALYCTVNSFTRMVATLPDGEVLRRWAARVGERVLV